MNQARNEGDLGKKGQHVRGGGLYSGLIHWMWDMGEKVELRITKEVLSLSNLKYVVVTHRGRRSTWNSMFVLVGDQ